MANIASILRDGEDPSMPALRAYLSNLAGSVSAAAQGFRTFGSEVDLNLYTPAGDEATYAFVADGETFRAYRFTGALPWVEDTAYFEGVAQVVQPLVDDIQQTASDVRAIGDVLVPLSGQVKDLSFVNTVIIDPASANDTGDGAGTDNGTFFMEGVFGDGATLIDTIVIYATTAVPACKVKLWQRNTDTSLTLIDIVMTVSLVDGQNTFTSADGDFDAFVPASGSMISVYSASGGMCKRAGTGVQTGLYFQGDRSGKNQTGALYAAFSLMVSIAGRTGSIVPKVAAVDARALRAAYPRALDFDPCHAAAGGDDSQTDNVTMFAPKTFGDMGMVGLGAVSGLRIRAEAAVAGAVLSLFDRSPDGRYTFVRDLWVGNVSGPALTTLTAGVDFDLTGAAATNTIGIYAPLTGIARSSDSRVPAYDAPYILGKFRGTNQLPSNFRPTPPLIAATLLVSAEPAAAPVYRLTTFFEGDQTTPALGTGSLAVYDGPARGPNAGLAFPVRRTVSYAGLPSGSFVRDPDVYFDAAQSLYFLTHTSHGYGTGDAGAIFGVACSRNGLDYTYLAGIDVSLLVPGVITAWAGQWVLSGNRRGIVLATSTDGVNHTTRLLWSADPMHRKFTLAGTVTGTQIPTNSIDAQIVELGGGHAINIKNEQTKKIVGAFSTGGPLGPYDTSIDLGLGSQSNIEGGQWLPMPDRLRLYYDRYGDLRLRARDYPYIGGAASAERAVDTGYQTPPLHGCVMLVAG